MEQLTVFLRPGRSGDSFVREFWRDAVNTLEQQGLSVAVPAIDDTPKFHLRYTSAGVDGIEVLRLETEKVSTLKETLDTVLSSHDSTIHGHKWSEWPIVRSRQFLTFLEACSVLRVKHGIWHPEDLAGFDGLSHDDCRYCQRAYNEMRKPGQAWSEALSPWFSHLDSSNLSEHDNHYEYGHWFGHILSRRFA